MRDELLRAAHARQPDVHLRFRTRRQIRQTSVERPPTVRYTFGGDVIASQVAISEFSWSSKLVRLGSLTSSLLWT
jgi:hypothetical protein